MERLTDSVENFSRPGIPARQNQVQGQTVHQWILGVREGWFGLLLSVLCRTPSDTTLSQRSHSCMDVRDGASVCQELEEMVSAKAEQETLLRKLREL